jgi:tetrahydromethanopterin S-methyltransferase subunit A
VGVEDATKIMEAIREAAATSPGPATPFAPERVVKPVRGTIPDRMIPDPAGYFVVYGDRARRLISTEHYTNEGVLDAVIEGAAAAEVYCTVVDGKLVSRLDHAAYLGRELALAERAIATGEPYVQDAAAEKRATKPGLLTLAPTESASSCGCGPSTSCGGPS